MSVIHLGGGEAVGGPHLLFSLVAVADTGQTQQARCVMCAYVLGYRIQGWGIGMLQKAHMHPVAGNLLQARLV